MRSPTIGKGVLRRSSTSCCVQIEAIAGTSSPTVFTAIATLEREGIGHEITGRKRNRVWAASDLMDALNELDARIAAAMRKRGDR